MSWYVCGAVKGERWATGGMRCEAGYGGDKCDQKLLKIFSDREALQCVKDHTKCYVSLLALSFTHIYLFHTHTQSCGLIYSSRSVHTEPKLNI